MSRTKLFFKEFIFIPCLVFTLAILFSKISLFNFFKSNINEFNGVKVIFVTVLSVILLESFLMFDVPKNLLFSRTIASIVMMATFFLFSFYFVRLKEVVNVIAAVFLGAVTNYIFQRFVSFRKANLVSIVTLVLITISLVALTYFKII